jgi:hypothetical protein
MYLCEADFDKEGGGIRLVGNSLTDDEDRDRSKVRLEGGTRGFVTGGAPDLLPPRSDEVLLPSTACTDRLCRLLLVVGCSRERAID